MIDANDQYNVASKQRILLSMMVDFHDFCTKMGIAYTIIGGTLLGAIREKGFIPWDDDIDIVMPREDYNGFVQYMLENADILTPLKLFTHKTCSDYPYMIGRVSNDDYYLDVENEKSYGMGVFIDVYPMDGVGETEKQMVSRKKRAARYSSLCYLATRKKCIKENTKKKVRRVVKPFAFLFAKMIGKRYFMNKLDQMSRELNYDESTYVGCLVWGSDGPKGVFPLSWMEPHKKLRFEDAEFRVPKEYDRILSRLYSNYMALPPKEDQIPHHFYKAFAKQD